MSTTRIRAAIVAVAAGAVVCGGALAGCSVSSDDEPDPPKGNGSSGPATATSEPTQDPSSTANPSAEPSPSSTASAPGPSPVAALLAAAELPQFNDTSVWTERRTGPAGARPFGLCQRFSLLDIGAMSAVERTFTTGTSSPDNAGDTAGQQVAEFPDAQNALRASKVIEAWHGQCAGRIKGRNIKVRPITDVAVPQGRAWWYLVSYERRGTGHFHSLGLVVSNSSPTNTRMTLIRMDHDGQDHIYEPGMDPMELAVKAASARLG